MSPNADMTCPSLAEVGDPDLDSGPELDTSPPLRNCCYSGTFVFKQGTTQGPKCGVQTAGTTSVENGKLVTTTPPACPEGDAAVKALQDGWWGPNLLAVDNIALDSEDTIPGDARCVYTGSTYDSSYCGGG